jgi:predicted nucleotidyltransferase/predicted transcriptional regulator
MFLSKTRENILKLFFNNPAEEFHLREISRRSNVVPHNVNKYTKDFVEEGLLIRRKVGNMTLYRINPKSDYLFKIFEIFEVRRKLNFFSKNKKITRLLNEYISNLVRLSNREIQMVVLFGSVARGEWTRGSDIDLLLCTATKSNRFIKMHEESEKKVRPLLEISPLHVIIDKIVDGFRDKLEFYDELWRDRIILYNEYLFWEVLKAAKF